MPKLKLAGENSTTGTEEPIPVNPTVWGLVGSASAIVNVPVSVPDAVGVKVTVTSHVPPGIKLVPQVLVWAKGPLAVMPVKLTVELPSFTMFTSDGELVVPTYWLLKERLKGTIASEVFTITEAVMVRVMLPLLAINVMG